MTILTIDKNIQLNKTNFSDLAELYTFLIDENIIPTLKELDEKEYSQDLINKAKECLNMDETSFINI